jgi:alanine dehydrogenase
VTLEQPRQFIMRVGTPKETKDQEHRVGLTPTGVAALRERGHEVVIERGAGLGSGFSDADYTASGAVLGTAADAWNCGLVVKVKEPLPSEYRHLREQILFTYLHLAAAPAELTARLLAAGTTAIAYETVEDDRGRLPLLAPMSAVAGAMAPLVGGHYLARHNGGRGTLLGTVLGRSQGRVAIVGDGVVGRHACAAAAALGSSVVVLGRHPERAAELERHGTVHYELAAAANVARAVAEADVVIGAVLLSGARTPHVVTEAMVEDMASGAVIVDVSIDQGGCVATSRPTSHAAPTFVAHGVTHYCVTNMPGAYPRTSTIALTEATLPYVLRLADEGLAAVSDQHFAKGVNTHAGRIRCRAVAEALGETARYASFDSAFEAL